MKYTVYQAQSRDTRFVCDPENWKAKRAHFTMAFQVTADDLDDVYLRTQLDVQNHKNSGVYHASEHVRSTSVGDVIIDEDGLASMVDSAGFLLLAEG